MTSAQPVFLVNPYNDPVLVRLQGRASYLNAGPLRDFFARTREEGKNAYAIDFLNCTGMDSTFLGIIAGLALDLRRDSPPGTLVLCRLGPRNRELVQNLGLDRLVEMAPSEEVTEVDAAQPLDRQSLNEKENAELILRAHQCLCDVDETNRAKFQDVIAYLKNQVDEAE